MAALRPLAPCQRPVAGHRAQAKGRGRTFSLWRSVAKKSRDLSWLGMRATGGGSTTWPWTRASAGGGSVGGSWRRQNGCCEPGLPQDQPADPHLERPGGQILRGDRLCPGRRHLHGKAPRGGGTAADAKARPKGAQGASRRPWTSPQRARVRGTGCRVLFVCSLNQWRSPTAEALYRSDPRLEVRSAGIRSNARRRIGAADLKWANVVYVMEVDHRRWIQERFGGLGLPPIRVLGSEHPGIHGQRASARPSSCDRPGDRCAHGPWRPSRMTAAPPVHFKKASEFQRWLKAHHDSAGELLVGFHTKQSGEAESPMPKRWMRPSALDGSTASAAMWIPLATRSGFRRAGREARGAW